MRMNHRVWLLTVLLSLLAGAVCAQTPGRPEPQEITDWVALAAHQDQGGIPPGTRITMQNWQQYQQYMPLGMIALFKGSYFWKMPRDVEIDVGPTVSYPVPKTYAQATEKYSGQVRVVHLPNGHNDIANYVGGEPFPNPQEPNKGYKLLTDLWFAYVPYLSVGGASNTLNTCTQDSYASINCQVVEYVYRQLGYNTDPRVPREDGRADDWFTEWIMVDVPEQSRYTSQLTLFPKDNQRNEELYIFLPSLRRSIRLSVAARCSPVLGTDFIQDDYKSVGFNGGIALFDAKFLAHRKILTLFGDYKPLGGDYPRNYYMPLGWPKPSWGQWQLRDVDVIDVRRVPSEQNGYCFGSRIIYEDSQTHYALWEDVFDANLKFWKPSLEAQREVKDPVVGFVPGPVTSVVWDVQNNHMTQVSTEDKEGHDLLPNGLAPDAYRDFTKYSTPGGLLQILR
jgi:uncharacterized protein DUF1329